MIFAVSVIVAEMDWGQFADRYGLPLAAIIVLAATGHRRYWVFGWTYRAMEDHWRERLDAAHQRESEWRRMALSGTLIAERTVGKRREWTTAEREAFNDDP